MDKLYKVVRRLPNGKLVSQFIGPESHNPGRTIYHQKVLTYKTNAVTKAPSNSNGYGIFCYDTLDLAITTVDVNTNDQFTGVVEIHEVSRYGNVMGIYKIPFTRTFDWIVLGRKVGQIHVRNGSPTPGVLDKLFRRLTHGKDNQSQQLKSPTNSQTS